MKLKTASFIMIAATAVDTLLYRIYFHQVSANAKSIANADGFLFIDIGGRTIAWFLLVKGLLWNISLLIFCVSLYRSERATRLVRTSSLILGITTCIALLMGICNDMDMVSDGLVVYNIGSLTINISFILSSMRSLSFAFFCLCFVLSSFWKRGLRIMAGILAVLVSLFYIEELVLNLNNQAFNTLAPLVLWLNFLLGLPYYPCLLIFFVLLTSSLQPSAALGMHGEASAGYVLHPKMRHILFSFQDRISRSTYWLRVFPFLFTLSVVLDNLKYMESMIWIRIISILLSLFSFWPALAAMAKRMHDRDYSAKWLLTLLIPFVNAIAAIWILFIVWFLKGTQGPNRFGPDPLQSSIEL
ncbi:MAG: DUF805 domain-containing protein [Planctomycetota bacterium]|jgi:uncharacterized membrane protein YhaH (DUF805 family)